MSNKASLKILIVDDERSIHEHLSRVFTEMGHDFESVLSGDAVKKYSQEDLSTFDVAFLDLKMPKSGMDGFETAEWINKLSPDTLFVMLTGHGGQGDIMRSFENNFVNFLYKPAIDETIKKVFDHDRIKKRLLLKVLEQNAFNTSEKYCMVGSSKCVQKLKNLILKAADSNGKVLIGGESGTGKEIVARAIHKHSKRTDKPFRAINIGAIPKETLESELFGHVRGAFTDASKDRVGKITEANGGTVFLDEIGEMPKGLQVKLLRVLQENEVEVLGSNKIIDLDVRFIAATNKDLKKEIKKGKFREDLYYRLNVINIDVPPLRERPEDIPELVLHFANLFKSEGDVPTPSPDVMDFLMSFPWPGNVRQLQNVIEKTAILNSWELALDDLDEPQEAVSSGHSSEKSVHAVALDELRVKKCKIKLNAWEEVAAEFEESSISRKSFGKAVNVTGQYVGQYVKSHRREFLFLLLGEPEKWSNIRRLDNIKELLDVAFDVKHVLPLVP